MYNWTGKACEHCEKLGFDMCKCKPDPKTLTASGVVIALRNHLSTLSYDTMMEFLEASEGHSYEIRPIRYTDSIDLIRLPRWEGEAESAVTLSYGEW